ncbi:MAG TPA: TonB-dependent receptor [Candidatus Dormibacteraeota bacterium]|nr:TonB-dependent receptor [Candidatus Dormibacteraeota bacterium]
MDDSTIRAAMGTTEQEMKVMVTEVGTYGVIRKLLKFAVLAAVIACMCGQSFAQTTASIKGTATDATGAAVAGAKVTVKNVGGGVERSTQTDSSGDYEVPALPPGVYRVEISQQGFETQVANEVTLAVSQNSVQNFSLKIAATATTVTIESTQPVIDSTTITVGQVIDQAVVQEIPLNGRHFVDLALLVPGTVTPPQNGFLTAPLRGQGSFAFNSAGGREDAVNFMINGVNLNDMSQNQVTFQPTINTVSEFKIDNSTYSAEYGRNSGSIVNIATRSGTNSLHGELYDYLRNNDLDARNFFNPIPVPQAVLKRNQFGGDVGGPIFKDKTFFFASYEGLRHRQGLPTTSGVLTDGDRNQINASGSAAARGLLQFIPAANGTINGAPAFFGSAGANVNIDQGTIDISHNFNEKDRVHGYYANQHDNRFEPTQGSNLPGFGDHRVGVRQVFTLGETHVFTPAIVNEFHFGVNRINITFTPNNPTDPATVGLGGVLGPNLAFIPGIQIQDKSGLVFGAERNFPQGRGDTTSVVGDTLDYIRGAHSLKFGFEFRDFRNDNFATDPGLLVFSTTQNFINGIAAQSARTIGASQANRITQNALDFFAQDSYKLKPYLTLELGLRYAWNMTPNEARNRFVTLDQASAALVPVPDPYNQNNKNVQPRVGFAWDIFHNGRTVLRSGYGYQVDQPITGVVTGLNGNPPFAVPISVTTATPLTALGALYDPNNATNVAPSVVNPNFKNAYVQSWNLNIQHQLTRNTGVMVGYFGSKGTHLEVDHNLNQFTTLGVAASKPFPVIAATSQFLPGKTLSNNITLRDSSSNSSYNALWVSANQHVTRGLQFNASYTYSHSIDDVSRNLQGTLVQDGNNIANSRGSSDFDARHRFVMNAIYELPFKGNRLVSGWEIAPIISAQTGNPFTVVLGTSLTTGTLNTIRPNLLAPVVISGNPSQWITNAATAFGIPAANSFGNLGRNTFTGPRFTDVDLALVKNTKITERFNLQFRVDTFDLLNHPNFGQPGPTGGTGVVILPTTAAGLKTFSTITSTRFPTADSGSSRQLQFALKLKF